MLPLPFQALNMSTRLPLLKRIHLLFALLATVWTVVAWQGVHVYMQQRTSALLSANARNLNNNATALGQAMKERLSHFALMPNVLARQQNLQEAAVNHTLEGSFQVDARILKQGWDAQKDLQVLNQSLRKSSQSFGVDLVFLLNAKGYCIASSNSYSDDSLIGTHYDDRQYFWDAMADHLGTQFLVGRKTGIPGLFFSMPVKFDRKIQGVLVIKADITRLAPMLSPYEAFITDQNGVVILASQPSLLSHVLPDSAFHTLSTSDRTLMYKATDLPRLPLNTLPDRLDGHTLYSLHQTSSLRSTQDTTTNVLLSTQNLPIGNLKLHILEPVTEAMRINQEAPYIIAAVILSGYFLLALAYLILVSLERMRTMEKSARQETQGLQGLLQAREAQLNSIVDHLPLMVVARDANTGMILRANPATQTVLQLDAPLVAGQAYDAELAPGLAYFLNNPHAHALGIEPGSAPSPHEQTVLINDQPRVLRAQTVSITEHKNHTGELLIDLVEDVTEARKSEAEIHRLAFVDTLTSLPNRTAFFKALQETLDHSHQNGSYGALLLSDLDGFKLVNERLGHLAGDQILTELSTRFQQIQSQTMMPCFVARLASDEFITILDSAVSTQQLIMDLSSEFGRTLLRQITLPYLIDGHPLHMTASIGITLFGPHLENDPNELLKETVAAMYEAKLSHRGGIHFFDEKIRQALNARTDLGNSLLSAVRSEKFQQLYQPQFNAQGQVVGVEALIRWNDETRGQVSPAVFIPLAESMHIVVDIDRWVLKTACETARLWADDPVLKNTPISINISAEYFSLDDFVDEVLAAMTAHQVRPDQLMIELTEGTIIEDTKRNQQNLERLKSIGLKVSIDDFGTGNSSLSYMQRFAIDQIKIDQSFVRDMIDDPRSLAIIEFIIKLARTLGYQTLAEGVETQAQYTKLIESGCNEFQGFLLSAPLSRQDCADFIMRNREHKMKSP